MKSKYLRLALVLCSVMVAAVTIAGIFTVYLLSTSEQAPTFLWTAILIVLAILTAASLYFSYQALTRRNKRPQRKTITANETRLTTVLDNLISAVVMIGKQGQIVLLNKAAEEMLGMDARQYMDKHYDVIEHQDALKDLMEQCLNTKQMLRDELVITYPEKRTLDVNIVPIMSELGEWSGMVIVLHDISEIRRLERIRSEFVANVSHELKTPIAAVKGFAETLLSGTVNDEETSRSFLKIIYDESDRLNRLIINILELSKIESKSAPLDFSPIELHEFITNTIHMTKTEAEKKGIQLSVDLPEEVYIEADEDRLQQVVLNLISNGISYTGEGGKVSVAVKVIEADEEVEELVQIIVSDSGIGIPEKDLPRIFERFYRVDKARSRSSGGTGLGLSIVKHIVDLHRGRIMVQSKINEGSKFIIELPIIQTTDL